MTIPFAVILTGSPDCSMLASDVETGKAIARLDEAHGLTIVNLVFCFYLIAFFLIVSHYAIIYGSAYIVNKGMPSTDLST